MRKTYALFTSLCFLAASTVFAVPAKPVKKQFTQPDGTQLTIVLQGDERFSYYATTDGIMLAEDHEGYMKYAVTDDTGTIIPGLLKAQNPQDRNSTANEYLAKNTKSKIKKALSNQLAKNSPMKLPGAIGSSKFPTTGRVKGLIILAQFQDRKFSSMGTQKEFTNMMNEEGYSKFEATGSARDYFISQSNGAFIPEFDVVGPVTLPQKMQYYGQGIMTTHDRDPAQMIVDACNLASKDFRIDFSDYDLDDDGTVDLVFVIFAGYSEAQGGPTDAIWPHAWDIKYGGKKLTLNEKSIRAYACSSELKGSEGSNLDGIGSFCHEFSHCLGLPDLYDTMYMGGYGMANWSIMDVGCYNNESRTPPGYSAFERYSVSWYTPEFLETPQKGITLEALHQSNQAYFIKSDANEDEYFTIENRQPEGWDAFLPGHGMMITHINYKPSDWGYNEVNTPYGFEKVQIVPADGTLNIDSMDGDAFPGTVNNTSFTDESTPAATLKSTEGSLGKPITNITEKEGIISFDFIGDSCFAPEMKEAASITKTSFTAEWSNVEKADSYTVTFAPVSDGQLLFAENFSGFKAGSAESPQLIKESLDAYTKEKGWAGNKVYQAGGACYLGSKAGGGYLTSPQIDLSCADTFTIRMEIKGANFVPSAIQPGLYSKQDGQKPFASTCLNQPGQTSIVEYKFRTNETDGFLKITTKDSVMIKTIQIYTGNSQKTGNTSDNQIYKNEKKQIIPDIKFNEYAFTGLSPYTGYIYNVRAIIGDKVSEPSKKMIVTTMPETGMEKVSPNSRIQIINNQILISSPGNETVTFYSPDGMLKYSFVTKEGTNILSVAGGLYIIRLDNVCCKAVIN